MGVQGELIRVKSKERLVINAYLIAAVVEVDSDEVRVL
jgi:hypothetical protein